MANATEELREAAVQQYNMDASELESMDAQGLSETLLRRIAQDKYNVDLAQTEGQDRRQLVGLLMQNMVSDLLKVDKDKVTMETSFSDLGADSLDMVELLMTIEDVFEPFGEMKIT